jgi:hypothetical protein
MHWLGPELAANEFMGNQLCLALGLDCAEARVISREDMERPEAVHWALCFPHGLRLDWGDELAR